MVQWVPTFEETPGFVAAELSLRLAWELIDWLLGLELIEESGEADEVVGVIIKQRCGVTTRLGVGTVIHI
jgi:hypothetical protein